MTDHSRAPRFVREEAEQRFTDSGNEGRGFVQTVAFYLQLTPRQLPSRFLYDALGSALFDAICHLPWYRITKAELELLRRHAATIGPVIPNGGRVVELGSGNGEKLATLLGHAGVSGVHVYVIDVSKAALARSAQALTTMEGTEGGITLRQATYEEGLLTLPPQHSSSTLVAFLGSNIGNFDPPGAAAFLGSIRAALQPGDHLLLGADLVKPEGDLLLAYDDPLGVTAAFNKNLLLRINTELEADFDLDRFAHRAIWNRDASRVEMRLVSLARQEVHVAQAALHFTLDEGETIWTESSYKYEPDGIRRLVEPAGFAQRNQWIDERARFALTLFAAV